MEYNIQNDETEIDLRKLWITMISKWRTIIIIGIIGAFLAGFISMLRVTNKAEVVPTYESTTTMQISFIEENSNSDQIKAALELTRSRTVMEQVIKNLKIGMTADELLELVSIESQNGSNIFALKIRVLNTKAHLARDIADEIRETAIKFINNSLNIESFKVLEQANLPNEPVLEEVSEQSSNSILKKAIIGGFLGILGAVFIIFIQFALNDKIQTPDDVEKYLGYRVLASIPMMEEQMTHEVNARKIEG